MQKLDAETKAKEVERKGVADKLRTLLGIEQIKSKEKVTGLELGLKQQQQKIEQLMDIQKLMTTEDRMKSQEKQAGARLGVDIVQGLEDDAIERERIASQERQAGLRGEVDLERADRQAEISEYQTDVQADTSRVQTMANLAGRAMDAFRSKKDSEQNLPKDE